MSKRRMKRRIRGWLRPARQWIAVWGFRSLIWICARLSHKRTLVLGRVAGSFGYRFLRKERRKALENLELVFGEEKSHGERKAIAREVFQSVAMAALEALNALNWSESYYREVIEFEGLEHLEAARAPRKGSVFITGHYGGWEIMSAAFLYCQGIKMDVLMRDFRNPRLTDLVREVRNSAGQRYILTDESPMTYMRTLKKGGVVSMVADQDSKQIRGVHVEFLGRPALTPVGPAFLARRTGAAILPIFGIRHRDEPTRHTMRIHPPIFADPSVDEESDVRRMLRDYSAALEEEIRSDPGQWAWIHDRWRHQPPRQEPAGEQDRTKGTTPHGRKADELG